MSDLTTVELWTINRELNDELDRLRAENAELKNEAEKTCLWKLTKHNKYWYYPACADIVTFSETLIRDWGYCPYCGHKIVKEAKR